MGIFCYRSGGGDRSLEVCDPCDGQAVGLTFISGAERSRQIGLAGMGRRQVRPELRRHHDPNPVFSVDDLKIWHRSHPRETPVLDSNLDSHGIIQGCRKS
jgi:hypothetical protein